MQDSLKLFASWNCENPTQRRALYLLSAQQYQEENILYLIGCWDYVFRPDDRKAQGLAELFIRKGSIAEINVSSHDRGAAMRMLTAPLTSRGKRRIRGGRQMLDGAPNKGGLTFGGTGNYNLMTKAIEMTLPVCMGQVDDPGLGQNKLSVAAKRGANGARPTKRSTDIVSEMYEYWGNRVVELGLGH